MSIAAFSRQICQRCAVVVTDAEGRQSGLHVGQALTGYRYVKVEVRHPEMLDSARGQEWLRGLRCKLAPGVDL